MMANQTWWQLFGKTIDCKTCQYKFKLKKCHSHGQELGHNVIQVSQSQNTYCHYQLHMNMMLATTQSKHGNMSSGIFNTIIDTAYILYCKASNMIK